MNWPDAIDSYLRDQRQAGRINSVETVRVYRATLLLHAEDSQHGPPEADREDVKRTLARWDYPNTRARGHTVLTSFYDWMLVEAYRPDNPARQVRTAKMRKPNVYRLTRSEVDAMIAACQTTGVERRVVLLGVCTGARVSELVGFQGRHFERPGFVWFSGDIAKGKRERWVPVLPELEPVAEEIRATVDSDHYVIRACDNSGGAFRAPGCPIADTSLRRIVSAVAVRAGITRRVYPHLLRHALGITSRVALGCTLRRRSWGTRALTRPPASTWIGRRSRIWRRACAACVTRQGEKRRRRSPCSNEFASLAERARAAGLDLAALVGDGPAATVGGAR